MDQTICQMEAFKILRLCGLGFQCHGQVLYSPDDQFEIVRVNVTSGQQVNTGDLLFVVKPTKNKIKLELDKLPLLLYITSRG
ncbi:MAG: hypothetical protein CM1200mP24_10290 [Gammaproteobacteria bacterium]|nr:MAG: hypothetical protein CM1200mP24_10290 [Gammaproteobacteria bacterium]